VRSLAIVVLRLLFRVSISGAEHIPAEGPAILAPNHENFLDAFFVGIATPRHVRYMAKVELFRGPLGWLFPRVWGRFRYAEGRPTPTPSRWARDPGRRWPGGCVP
jgi:1-acyl-sn-glycerol-3-phosphate acyltransferase